MLESFKKKMSASKSYYNYFFDSENFLIEKFSDNDYGSFLQKQ